MPIEKTPGQKRRGESSRFLSFSDKVESSQKNLYKKVNLSNGGQLIRDVLSRTIDFALAEGRFYHLSGFDFSSHFFSNFPHTSLRSFPQFP